METLELAFEVDGARPGTDRCADNPLARATDCLFRQGRPFSRLSKCFFRGIDGRLRWLGIFVGPCESSVGAEKWDIVDCRMIS